MLTQTHKRAVEEYGKSAVMELSKGMNNLQVRELLVKTEREITPWAMDILMHVWKSDITRSKKTSHHFDAVKAASASRFVNLLKEGAIESGLPSIFSASSSCRIVWPVRDAEMNW